jgi:hypothetical protein
MFQKWQIIVVVIFAAGCSQPSLPTTETLEIIKPTDTIFPSIPSEPTYPPEPTNTLESTATPKAGNSEVVETDPFDLKNVALPDFQGDPLPINRAKYTSGSGVCAICHTGLTDGSGQDVSIDSFWRSTMMANAARDPYWLAAVRAETLNFPELAEAI